MTIRWTAIENANLSGEDAEEQEVVENTSLRLLSKDYIDLTIKCVEENGPYIVIIPGLALSHSRPDVSVNKTGLSLITLSKPVCFDCDNDPVDIVLTLAATDDTSHLQKLQSMAEFISDEENIEFIKNAKSAEEGAKAINEFEPEE